MTTSQTTPAKRANATTSARGPLPKKAGGSAPADIAPIQADEDDALRTERISKHDRVLTLLSRRDGTTIPELMIATGWQQHSVRGFLAGTVKKKLGFPLTSSKAEGELRRYRIDSRRGR